MQAVHARSHLSEEEIEIYSSPLSVARSLGCLVVPCVLMQKQLVGKLHTDQISRSQATKVLLKLHAQEASKQAPPQDILQKLRSSLAGVREVANEKVLQ